MVRNSQGAVLAAMRLATNFCSNSTTAESRAALTACLFYYRDLGLSNVIFEGDAKVVVNVVNKS